MIYDDEEYAERDVQCQPIEVSAVVANIEKAQRALSQAKDQLNPPFWFVERPQGGTKLTRGALSSGRLAKSLTNYSRSPVLTALKSMSQMLASVYRKVAHRQMPRLKNAKPDTLTVKSIRIGSSTSLLLAVSPPLSLEYLKQESKDLHMATFLIEGPTHSCQLGIQLISSEPNTWTQGLKESLQE